MNTNILSLESQVEDNYEYVELDIWHGWVKESMTVAWRVA